MNNYVFIIINSEKIILHACYIPPNSSFETFNKHCISIEKLFTSHPNSTFIFTGNFNLPNIKWENSDNYTILNGQKTNRSELLEELIAFLQLFQHNFTTNHCSNILDLILSNNINLIV